MIELIFALVFSDMNSPDAFSKVIRDKITKQRKDSEMKLSDPIVEKISKHVTKGKSSAEFPNCLITVRTFWYLAKISKFGFINLF